MHQVYRGFFFCSVCCIIFSIKYPFNIFSVCRYFQCPYKIFQSIHAIHHLAVETPFVKNGMVLDLAPVCRNTLVIHTPDVDQSVYKIPNVIAHVHVSITNAKIHARACVALMPNVLYRIIRQVVIVDQVILVIQQMFVE